MKLYRPSGCLVCLWPDLEDFGCSHRFKTQSATASKSNNVCRLKKDIYIFSEVVLLHGFKLHIWVILSLFIIIIILQV